VLISATGSPQTSPTNVCGHPVQLADPVASVAVSIIPRVGTVTDRARLVSRIEVEARAFRNAEPTTRHLRYGRVLGLLDAG